MRIIGVGLLWAAQQFAKLSDRVRSPPTPPVFSGFDKHYYGHMIGAILSDEHDPGHGAAVRKMLAEMPPTFEVKNYDGLTGLQQVVLAREVIKFLLGVEWEKRKSESEMKSEIKRLKIELSKAKRGAVQ